MARLIGTDPYRLDELDRRIIHALTIDARAPARAMAGVLSVSTQTVARRVRLLRERASLRVTGRLDAARAGWSSWYLRIQCVPGSAPHLASALAGRGDTSWVVVASGGTEVSCALEVRTPHQRDALLLEGLPSSRRVVHVVAHALLHDYSPPAWGVYANGLSAEEAAQLDTRVVLAAADPVRLREDDGPILALLAEEGRATSAGIAARVGRDESTVRRRIDELRRSGLLWFEVDLDPGLLGMGALVMLWASIEPGRLDRVGQAMATHDEIPFVAATTGPTNLMASLACPDMGRLHGYLTTRLAALGGVRAVETSPVLRVVKRAGPMPARPSAAAGTPAPGSTRPGAPAWIGG